MRIYKNSKCIKPFHLSFLIFISGILFSTMSCGMFFTMMTNTDEDSSNNTYIEGITVDGTTYEKTIQNIIIAEGATESVVMTDDSSWVDYCGGDDTVDEVSAYKGVFTKNRTVILSPYVLGQYEITQEFYKAVMSSDSDVNATPSDITSEAESGETQNLRPVECVTWYDALYFCNKLTIKTMSESDCVYTITDIIKTDSKITSATVTSDITKKGYRLPTEAEWEYAARGGDPAAEAWKYAFSGIQAVNGLIYDTENAQLISGDTNLAKVSWYYSNAKSKTHEVGLKLPNTLGLYDMSGNVQEWCWDGSGLISEGTVTNPQGPDSSEYRSMRGGSCSTSSSHSCVSSRVANKPDVYYNSLGFRIARTL